jgi:carbon storage regulator CsrA
MLVLTRKAGQTIVLPDLGITVEVVRIGNNRVTVGITARDRDRVFRGELVAGETGSELTRPESARGEEERCGSWKSGEI